MVNQQSVIDSGFRIAPYIRRTPTLYLGAGVHLKLEHLQLGGVFKTRGAFNVILRGLESGALTPEKGIVIASGGNAALATAIAAQQLNVPCYAFVPANAPEAKVSKLAKVGAQVVSVGSNYQEAFGAASDFAVSNRFFLSHAYDHADVIDGAGTIGLEVLEQIPNVDTILVSCGGGGLYAGIAHAVGHKINVIPR